MEVTLGYLILRLTLRYNVFLIYFKCEHFSCFGLLQIHRRFDLETEDIERPPQEIKRKYIILL